LNHEEKLPNIEVRRQEVYIADCGKQKRFINTAEAQRAQRKPKK
jgi:hypothetical protein